MRQKGYWPAFSLFLFVCLSFSNGLRAQGRTYKSLREALAEKDSVESLDLSRQGLTAVPIEILEFRNLKRLRLYRNKLDSVPVWLTSLEHLHYLDLSSNYIDSLDGRLSSLPLDTLVMWDNPIYSFPESFSDMDLKYLDLRAIQMNRDEQRAIRALFPNARIRMDHPCNCGR